MGLGKIWFLNLDAELEMAAPRDYEPTQAILAHVAANQGSAREVLGPDDVLLDDVVSEHLSKGGFSGRAWCSTPRTRRAFEAAGITPEDTPDFEIVRRVNDRRFCAELGQTLPSAAFFEGGLDAVREHIGTSDGNWLLKRSFGVAGRCRRSVARASIADADVRWIARSFELGGLQVEPRVEIEAEFALHGFLSQDGDLTRGIVCVQRCDANGVWQGTRIARMTVLSDGERAALEFELDRAAGALEGAGYFGPFGIDAYRWRDAAGRSRFNPRGEINARYSLGWSVGMGTFRPE